MSCSSGPGEEEASQPAGLQLGWQTEPLPLLKAARNAFRAQEMKSKRCLLRSHSSTSAQAAFEQLNKTASVAWRDAGYMGVPLPVTASHLSCSSSLVFRGGSADAEESSAEDTASRGTLPTVPFPGAGQKPCAEFARAHGGGFRSGLL